MIKDILLVVENSAHANPIIRAAVTMAERMTATLTIEVLTASPLLIPALAPMTTMYVPDWSMAEDEADQIKAISASVAGSSAVIRVLGLRDDAMSLARRAGRAGPIADLVVMGGEADWETQWLRRRASETIIMGAGTPLLILAGAHALPPVLNAVLGWKDSPEARRAVHDLAALAEPGAKVSVVTVGTAADDDRASDESADEVVRHLIRRGLLAERKSITSPELSDTETLEAFALEEAADLLAIGAFGHSRLREVMFGGVTRSLLDKVRLPLLLSR
ncbi:universal stress protein [Sphingomonas sp. BE137]|jgi:nucleotide-binding universal stress UspA family protein|uniref:universal stress protein n=1 Tax=Sphingomonas sp. BE137 TaxID=2817844 RepID=UPI001AE620A6|nr:universal stress protein [Sphingomonas sp. BE137]MDR6850323.1 nucleotide-binding universal stress UspA family protein [Sphingomonas sp. BE137]